MKPESEKKLLLFAIVAVTMFRFAMIGHVGLGDDEAYYWDWTRNLDVSYFDHPPMIAYVIALSTWLGGTTEFFVRLPALLFSLGATWLIYMLALLLFDNVLIALRTAVVINFIPVLAVGAVFVAPDLPMAFFWVLSAVVTYLAISKERPALWYLAGICAGLGILSKYHVVLFPVSILLFLALSDRHRHWLRRKEPYLATVIMLLFFIPVLYWNYKHDWASFMFHLAARHHGPKNYLNNAGQFLGSQVGLISPLLFIGILAAIFRSLAIGRRRGDDAHLYLFSLSAPIIIFFALTCPFTNFKPHWSAMGYLTGAICLFAQLAEPEGGEARPWYLRAKFTAWGVGLTVLFSVLIYVQGLYPLFEKIYPVFRSYALLFNIKSLPPYGEFVKGDVTNELYGWDDAGKLAAEVLNGMPKDKETFVFSYMYQNTSQLAFYMPGRPRVYRLGNRTDHYSFLQNEWDLVGKNAIYVCHNKYFEDPRGIFKFERIEDAPAIRIFRQGEEVRIFYIFRCYNYRPGVKAR